MERILIKHLIGSKANQIEAFAVGSSQELSLGRDQTASVTFDPEKDNLVSRRHALIKVNNHDKLSFTILDLGSTNGTFVNGERITGERELLPEDIIQLGAGGPELAFDVEPRPAHLIGRTRVMPRTGATGTHLSAAASSDTQANTAVLSKVGVGRATVERLLFQERQAASQLWMYGLAAVLAVVAIVGGSLYYRNIIAEQRVEERVKATTARFAEQADKMTPKQIAATYRESTVMIRAQWRLYDKESSKQIFHKYRPYDRQLLPAYVRLKKDHRIVRWLMTDNEEQTNRPIRQDLLGSGFVVRSDGFILTNKHLANSWVYPYQSAEPKGLLYEEGDELGNGRLFNTDDAAPWTPTGDSLLFEDKRPLPLKREPEPFQARSEGLEVRLPGNALSVEGRFIRAASNGDVALIKIDVPDPVTYPPLAAPDYKPVRGEPVTVIGYPNISAKTFAVLEWVEDGQPKRKAEEVPEPTVTDGIIANIGGGIVRGEKNSNIMMVGEGELYQLTVNTTGQGNSGGPVFNSDGKVIALLTSMKSGSVGELVSSAVPIKYGHDILKLDRVTQ